MKNLCFILFMLGTGALYAQDMDTTKKAAIYNLYIMVNDEVKNEYAVNDDSKTFLSGYSISDAMPDSLLDSIRVVAVRMVQDYLNMPTELVYKVNKKGENVTTIGANDEIEDMPTNTLGGAIDDNDHDLFVYIWVNITSGGKSTVDLGFKRYSKVKPMVDVTVKIQDAEKEMIYKPKASLKDFEKLRQTEDVAGTITVREAETLSPVDIYNMYCMGLEAAFSEEE